MTYAVMQSLLLLCCLSLLIGRCFYKLGEVGLLGAYVGLNALACNNIKNPDFNMSNALNEGVVAFKALGATDALQEMLVAQMLSIHNLQQTAAAMANGTQHTKSGQYFTNTAIKLANCFSAQVNRLAQLQGKVGQKITISKVNVHQGAQAIVGHVSGGTPITRNEK
jgi:hypothetical protein